MVDTIGYSYLCAIYRGIAMHLWDEETKYETYRRFIMDL